MFGIYASMLTSLYQLITNVALVLEEVEGERGKANHIHSAELKSRLAFINVQSAVAIARLQG